MIIYVCIHILLNDFIIVYYHTRGNHWNISGNHYWYFHDIKTGEFISEANLTREQYDQRRKPLSKCKFLAADFKELNKIRETNFQKLQSN